MTRHQQRDAFVSGCVLSIGLACATPSAAQWHVDAGGEAEGVYDSNPVLSVTDPQELAGVILTPTFRVARLGDSFDIQADAEFGFEQFVVGDEFNTETQDFTVRTNHRGSKSELGLSARYARDNARRNLEDNLGNFEPNSRVNVLDLDTTYTRALAERTRLNLGASYLNQTYEEERLRDFDFVLVTAGLRQALAPQYTLTFDAGVGDIDTDPGEDADATIYFASGGFQAQITSRLSLRASGGPEWVDQFSTADGKTDVDTGYRVGAEATYGVLDDFLVTTSFDRRSSPSGIGAVVQDDRYSLTLTKRLSQRSTVRTVTTYVSRDSEIFQGT
ncbi:MAG: hypothetical protein AAF225_12525, partial [Pseudomonadota bacterium]